MLYYYFASMDDNKILECLKASDHIRDKLVLPLHRPVLETHPLGSDSSPMINEELICKDRKSLLFRY